MVISSWVVGVANRAAETNAVIVGLLVILLAALGDGNEYERQPKAPTTP
jgi:hypothetical protein